MKRSGRDKHPARGIMVLAVGAVLVCQDARARGDLGGRFWLTFQEADNAGFRQEYFAQHYEATVRDRVLSYNNLSLTLYLDDSKDLLNHLTYRRYRGQVSLSHAFYSLNARVSPRQEVTPLEREPSLEVAQNQFALDVHVPKAPRLRLGYEKRTQYLEARRSTDVRDLRGDLRYEYKILEVQLNRWNARSTGGNDAETDVTGAQARLTKTVGDWLTTTAGYEYRLTETDRLIGTTTEVTNHTVNGVINGRYRRVASGVLAVSTRRLSTRDVVDVEGQDDNVNLALSFLEAYWVRPEVSRTYVRSEQNGLETRSDYASLQLLFDGEIRKGTTGRLQLTRRIDIDTRGGVLPAHIYSASVRSRLYQGVDLRAEANANERLEDSPQLDRFQTASIIDLFLVPIKNMSLTPHVQHTRSSDEFSFRKNDRASWGLTANYSPAFPRMSMGFDVNRSRVTSGDRRTDTSGVVNLSFMLRSRSTMNVSYGVREAEEPAAAGANPAAPGGRAETFNAQAQIWVARRASFSVNYTNVSRERADDTEQFAVTYRQDI